MDAWESGPENELTDLERRLTRWQPTAAGLNRDRVMYESGRAAARADVKASAALFATAAVVIVSAVLGTMLVRERAARNALEGQIARLGPPPGRITTPIEPPDSHFVLRAPEPESYLALTHRGRTDQLDDVPFERPAPAHGRSPEFEPPLRMRNVGGVLKF